MPSSSNITPPENIAYFTALLNLDNPLLKGLPRSGILVIAFLMLFFVFWYSEEVLSLLKCSERPPFISDIDIPLSFRTIISLDPRFPRLLSASNEGPPVIAPSPITAITSSSPLLRSLATASPIATEIDVLECPVS